MTIGDLAIFLFIWSILTVFVMDHINSKELKIKYDPFTFKLFLKSQAWMIGIFGGSIVIFSILLIIMSLKIWSIKIF